MMKEFIRELDNQCWTVCFQKHSNSTVHDHKRIFKRKKNMNVKGGFSYQCQVLHCDFCKPMYIVLLVQVLKVDKSTFLSLYFFFLKDEKKNYESFPSI